MLIFKKEMRMILFKLKRRKTVILFLCAISFIIWNIPRHAKNTNNEIIQDEIRYNECVDCVKVVQDLIRLPLILC